MKRLFFLTAILLFGIAASAWATPAGENYWLSFGPFLTAAGQFLPGGDEISKATDAYLGGGLGCGHSGDFSFMLQAEGGAMPLSRSGQLRGEARLGFKYLTLGPTFAGTIGRYSIVTIGPAVSFDYPILTGATAREGKDHLLSLFYRLDVPVGGNVEGLRLRHQAGVRFLFDVPLFTQVFAKPSKSWWGGSWQTFP
jgi:hypothetical protein